MSNHIERVKSAGCLICHREKYGFAEADSHHLIDHGRRMGPEIVIGLCPTHHRSGLNDQYFTSIHPWTRAFYKRYGSPQELLDYQSQLLKETYDYHR